MDLIYRLALIIHLFAAIVLVGFMMFNAFVLMPALRRLPPAYAATVADKVGSKLTWVGPVTLVLLGVTGLIRLDYYKMLGDFFTTDFMLSDIGWRLWMMFTAWVILLGTGTLALVWYDRYLTKKLPYSAGLRELEQRRATQERISRWQDRLNYINVTLGILAALGGALFRAL
jgi:hypothetical protein